ncbi:MAG: helicase, partial [Alphaproteobacteria bacterium]|nr:helicase [Alphaproteobacteria bacterium]
MQAIQDKQFKLNETGQVLFQRDPTNPLPGEPVARLQKGTALMAPVAVLDEGDVPVALKDRDTAQARLNEWIVSHLNTVIGPLVALATADAPEIDTPVAQISRRLHDALGILPRADVDTLIEGLDQDSRRDLRSRRVRLGPVLISMPDLTKPAAVRLRALLWALWNDKELPVAIPPDGMVSMVIDPPAIDPVFYRSIGYPVYAKRAIRVDMLDRVISAIYDNADKGVFKAKHEMAEWLGCPIAELYDILTAMGHTKLSDPADEPKPVVTEEAAPVAVEAEAPVEAAPATEDSAPTEVPVPVPQVKPELATFRLRRGRAHEAAREHKPREHA